MNFVFSTAIAIITAALTPIGAATIYYAAEGFEGEPLYCNNGRNDLFYRKDMPPWLAVDISEYLSGRTQCGDTFWVMFTDGQVLIAQALDAGYLYGPRTRAYPELPILIDVPEYFATFPGVMGILAIVNISARER